MFVIRVKDGSPEWVDVKKGAAKDDLVEVIGPLREGDLVLVRGTDEIREGTHLNIRVATAKKVRP